MTSVFLETPKRLVDVEIDGQAVRVPEGATVLDACRGQGIDTPTLCYLENLTPVNVCRVCVVEVEGSRTLVPACSRKAEAGMKVAHGLRAGEDLAEDGPRVPRPPPPTCPSPRATCSAGSPSTASTPPGTVSAPRTTRRGSGTRPAPASTTPPPARDLQPWRGRDGRAAGQGGQRGLRPRLLALHPCYKCVEACGEDAQNTFAIAVAGRGFDARISTEFDVTLPDSPACTAATASASARPARLMPASEFNMRQAGHLGRVEADGDVDDLPLLRRRLQPGPARAGQHDRQGHVPARQRGHPRPPVRQGPLRLRVRPAPPPRGVAGQPTITACGQRRSRATVRQ